MGPLDDGGATSAASWRCSSSMRLLLRSNLRTTVKIEVRISSSRWAMRASSASNLLLHWSSDASCAARACEGIIFFLLSMEEKLFRMPTQQQQQEPSNELLRAKLEAAELRLRVQQLTGAITTLEAQLRENAALLRTQRLPPRPRMSSVEKALVAARQGFRCPGPNSDPSACPLHAVTGGMFTSSLWEVDHDAPYSESGLHTGNLTARCPCCHAARTRAQCVARFHRGEACSEDEDGD